MIGNFIANASLYVVPLLLAVTAHEVAHGWVADKRGDTTARDLGRITLNPFAHIDLVGTIILPAILILTRTPFLFGWAKPVPVRFENLRGGRKDMALVAASGPVANLLLAIGSALVYRAVLAGNEMGLSMTNALFAFVSVPLKSMAAKSVELNLVLMTLNLLPVPPLDGGRILIGLLPERLGAMLEPLERFGLLIVLLLIGTDAWGYVMRPILKTFLRFFLY
ncbi:MAG: site-2 protease family protein [Syntrophobacteraceae bacterium]